MTALHGTAVLGLVPLPSVRHLQSVAGERWEGRSLVSDWEPAPAGDCVTLTRRHTPAPPHIADSHQTGVSVQ
jgi:hypothetical protein